MSGVSAKRGCAHDFANRFATAPEARMDMWQVNPATDDLGDYFSDIFSSFPKGTFLLKASLAKIA